MNAGQQQTCPWGWGMVLGRKKGSWECKLQDGKDVFPSLLYPQYLEYLAIPTKEVRYVLCLCTAIIREEFN